MSVGVMKDCKLKLSNLRASHTLGHRVGRGTGTPKDKDEVKDEMFTSVMGEYVFLK